MSGNIKLDPFTIWRNHLQRAKHSLNLAQNTKGTESLNDGPIGNLINTMKDHLDKLVQTADEVSKELGDKC